MPEPVQRRLAAILAADVAGYSALMGVDEESTLARLTAHRGELVDPTIARHRGRIVKTTGDGMLVEFGSVVDAVRAAVELQRGMLARNAEVPEATKIRFRIGITVGDIIIQDGDIFGDGVNIAARLEGIAEPDGICISDDAWRQVRGKLDVPFEDIGEQRLKNIAAPVRVHRARLGAGLTTANAETTVQEKPSIAVLPFTNMSGDPGQQYLSDGITEDIITELSRFRHLSVASRLASFHFAGKGGNLTEIARQLNADFIVEGSVRKSGDRMRITAQLIDAKSGAHIWADRYDRVTQDIFGIQDDTVKSIVAMLDGRMVAAVAATGHKKPTANWTAYDCLLQGRQLCNDYREPEAVPLFERAVSLDPQFALAHAWLGIALSVTYLHQLESEGIARANAASKQALDLDSNEATAHWSRAMALLWSGQLERSRVHFERAMSLNPADIQIRGDFAEWQRMSGHPAAALATIETALAQGPFVPQWFSAVRGEILFDLGRYAEAVELLEATPPHYVNASLYLAAAYSQMNDDMRAMRAMANVLKARPYVRVSHLAQIVSYTPTDAQSRFLEGVRKAGLPE